MRNNELTNQTHPLITPDHLRRLAVVYIRRSTDYKRSLATVAMYYGWPDSQIEINDEDLGTSGISTERRGWQRLQMMIDANQVGAVFVTTTSRLSRQILDIELFRQRAALHNTLLYTDGRIVNLADLK
jgi:DNA invertase Pin-like site-specific DNA recombinase